MADKTEDELRKDCRDRLLAAATALDYFGSVVDDHEWIYHKSDVLRDLAEVIDPAGHHWDENVVPLRTLAKVPPVAPDRPRCRG